MLEYDDDLEQQKKLLKAAPWKKEAKYFRHVQISSLALVKMAVHASKGGAQEVMGVMTGKIVGSRFIVLDAYALPVEATETRVNAMGEAYEYMVRYLEGLQAAGRNENIVGWYHSHPGYGCWLSRIDIDTQAQNQKFQDPFLAVVIDPVRTVANERVEIGAFRTLPDTQQTRTSEIARQPQQPQKSIDQEFGLYADMYYALEVSYFQNPFEEPLFNVIWSEYSTIEQTHRAEVNGSNQEVSEIIDLADSISKMAHGTRKSTEQNPSQRASAGHHSAFEGEATGGRRRSHTAMHTSGVPLSQSLLSICSPRAREILESISSLPS